MNWVNWSGSVNSMVPVLRPRTEAELGDAVRNAGKVRATGAGHSFMPLCVSHELIVSLEDMAGTMTISHDRKTAQIPAGWSVKRISAALADEGLALANQGDVNSQSLAGAMATATHGTGKDLGNLSTFARGFRLVDAHGEIKWCNAQTNANLFEAQRLSLGLFGIATEIECEVVPAYYLAERVEKMRWGEVRERFDELTCAHRHAEFWFFPYADDVILKTLSLIDPCEVPPSTSDIDETLFNCVLKIGAKLPLLIPNLQRLMMKTNFNGGRHGPAHAIFPSNRTIRFEEMEYEMPKAVGIETLSAAVDWIRKKSLPVTFPFEYRVVAGDDIWMSPMNKGPVAAISMHQYASMPWQSLFADTEAIFRDHGGRPHWAKRHTLSRVNVDALYPMAERYRNVRRAVDPGGKFLNAHMAELFS